MCELYELSRLVAFPGGAARNVTPGGGRVAACPRTRLSNEKVEQRPTTRRQRPEAVRHRRSGSPSIWDSFRCAQYSQAGKAAISAADHAVTELHQLFDLVASFGALGQESCRAVGWSVCNGGRLA